MLATVADSTCPLAVRADIIFFIFLYQRYIYKIDLKRVNEYGQVGTDHAKPAEDGGDDAAAQPPIAIGDQAATETPNPAAEGECGKME